MSDWYYARDGRQTGPVTFEALQEVARRGELDPMGDLVWTSSMKDWVPAGTVQGLYTAAPAAPPVPLDSIPADPSNPYAAPQTLWHPPVAPTGEGGEIEPGSEQIDPVACIKRGFDLTLRNFGIIILVGLVYIGVLFGANVVLGFIDSAMGWGQSVASGGDGPVSTWMVSSDGSVFSGLASQVLSIFLSLGITRIFLNLASGQQVEVGMIFGQGGKLLKALAAYVLFGIAVVIGFLLLIVPGVYLVLRFGFYLPAMVDRDLGIMESFQYSSRITTNNRVNILVLGLLSLLAVFAGVLALCVGVIFAYPLIMMAWMVAYRWMQYGSRVALNDPVVAG